MSRTRSSNWDVTIEDRLEDVEGVITQLLMVHMYANSASWDGSSGSGFSWGSHKIASKGVSNVERLDTGIFKVTWQNAYPNTSYTVVATAGSGNHTSSGRTVTIDERATTHVTLRCERTDNGTQQDEAYIAVIVVA